MNSARVGRYCGDEAPPLVETSGNTARVLFRTDGSVSNGGFRAFYTSYNEACKYLIFCQLGYSVTCLNADPCLTAGVASLIPYFHGNRS